MICCRRTRAANTEIIQATIFCTVFLFGGGDAGYASTLLQSMNTPSVMSASSCGGRPSWLVAAACASGRKIARTLPERVAGQVSACGVARLYAQFALDKLLLEACLS